MQKFKIEIPKFNSMKNTLFVLLLLLTIKIAGQSQTRKVLFLGNSYTYVNDLPLMVSEFALNTGDILQYDSNLPGGYTLGSHFTNTTSLNKILSKDWDYVVLQEQSQLPSFPNSTVFIDGFTNLSNYIKQNKPCAQVSAFMTWGYVNGDTQNCAFNPTACTYTGMQTLLSSSYMNAANINGAEVTPVGVVWKYIRENHPTINLYQSDGSHPSLAGSYVAAVAFYTSIFRKNPTLITNNYGLDPATALIIRNATKALVFDQMATYYIGNYNTPCSLSTNETEKISEVSIYPNPVQNYLNIYTESPVKEAFIYDLAGRKVTADKVTSKSYDVSSYESGVYFINLVFENGKSNRLKFIKK